MKILFIMLLFVLIGASVVRWKIAFESLFTKRPQILLVAFRSAEIIALAAFMKFFVIAP